MNIQELNTLKQEDAHHVLSHCCHSEAWVNAMLSARPFSNLSHVIEQHNLIWDTLAEDDFLEAFLAHPMIGDIDSLRKKYSATKDLSSKEQSGVSLAKEATLKELALMNKQYLDKFGFIFIIFATGKSADEMLAALNARINNTRASEITNAAIEQKKISELRLNQLLEEA